MRKITLLLLTCFLAVAATSYAGGGEKIYGQGISAADTVRISNVLAHPDDYLGKVIRVTGTAVGVCKHQGCWVELASDTEGQSLRVKVKDGEIVFPPEIVGDTVTAEGVWTSNVISLQPENGKHAGKEGPENVACDNDKDVVCKTVYQLSGTGAVVADK